MKKMKALRSIYIFGLIVGFSMGVFAQKGDDQKKPPPPKPKPPVVNPQPKNPPRDDKKPKKPEFSMGTIYIRDESDTAEV